MNSVVLPTTNKMISAGNVNLIDELRWQKRKKKRKEKRNNRKMCVKYNTVC